MIPATYPRDPIVEAVAQVLFAPDAGSGSAVPPALLEAFRAEYPGSQQRRPMTTGGGIKLGVFLLTGDGKALIGLSENLLTVHVVAPYPGWVQFRPRIGRALETYTRAVGGRAVAQIGIRYVDRIALPLEAGEGITDYFPFMPLRPESMPSNLDGFHVVTQASDPTESFTGILRLASLPERSSDGHVQVLYDLNLLRQFNPPAPLSNSAAVEHLDFLHDRQRKIFEDSITDRTRGLFQ